MKEVEVKMRFDLGNEKEREMFRKIMEIYEADDMPAAVTLQHASGQSKKADVPAPSETKAPAAEAQASGLTLEELRAIMATKQDHRSALKAKLTELGAVNLRALSPDKYQEFYNFMQTL